MQETKLKTLLFRKRNFIHFDKIYRINEKKEINGRIYSYLYPIKGIEKCLVLDNSKDLNLILDTFYKYKAQKEV